MDVPRRQGHGTVKRTTVTAYGPVRMDSRTFLGLEPTHNRFRWTLPVTMGVCTGGGFLFGGAGLAAAISALEGTTGRQCIWATAQYLSYAKPGSVLDIDVILAVEGHQITQARAVGHVGNREVLTVNAALGDRPLEARGQWITMPQVPGPEDCPPRVWRHQMTETINHRLDARLAKGANWDEIEGNPGDGQTLMWTRIPEVLDRMDAAALAVLGDWVPFGVGQALGAHAGGNSLDNTLRVASLVSTEWALLDIRVHALERGFGQGLVHIWAQDGTLLATASQSCIARFWDQTKENR